VDEVGMCGLVSRTMLILLALRLSITFSGSPD
jgi:hypothetical protein